MAEVNEERGYLSNRAVFIYATDGTHLQAYLSFKCTFEGSVELTKSIQGRQFFQKYQKALQVHVLLDTI